MIIITLLTSLPRPRALKGRAGPSLWHILAYLGFVYVALCHPLNLQYLHLKQWPFLICSLLTYPSACWRSLAMQYGSQLQFQLEENVFRLKIGTVHLERVRRNMSLFVGRILCAAVPGTLWSVPVK